jgi:hypothetical protein
MWAAGANIAGRASGAGGAQLLQGTQALGLGGGERAGTAGVAQRLDLGRHGGGAFTVSRRVGCGFGRGLCEWRWLGRGGISTAGLQPLNDRFRQSVDRTVCRGTLRRQTFRRRALGPDAVDRSTLYRGALDGAFDTGSFKHGARCFGSPPFRLYGRVRATFP